MESAYSRTYSFRNLFQTNITVLKADQEFLVFEQPFFMEWGNCIQAGTNFFRDPNSNILRIEFHKPLLDKRLFRASYDLLNFFKLNEDEAYMVCTLYLGERCFKIRIFTLRWKEIEYLKGPNLEISKAPFISSRFFASFRVWICPTQSTFEVEELFLRFWKKDLVFDEDVYLIDPEIKKWKFSLVRSNV